MLKNRPIGDNLFSLDISRDTGAEEWQSSLYKIQNNFKALWTRKLLTGKLACDQWFPQWLNLNFCSWWYYSYKLPVYLKGYLKWPQENQIKIIAQPAKKYDQKVKRKRGTKNKLLTVTAFYSQQKLQISGEHSSWYWGISNFRSPIHLNLAVLN